MNRYCARLVLAAVVFASIGIAQTTINLRTQVSDVDFTGTQYTKPFKSGTVLPAICSPGEFFFKSDAAAGRNLHACIAPNIWVVQGFTSDLPATPGPGVLASSGSTASWTPTGGDVSGNISSLVVQGLQGRTVAGTAPVAGQAMVWNQGLQRWEPQTIPLANADNTWRSKQIFEPMATQTLTDSSTIAPGRAVVQISAASDVTLGPGTNIADGVDGQWLTIVNVGSQFSVTLNPEELQTGSNMRTAGNTTLTIAPRGSATFFFSGVIGDWVQSAGGGGGGSFSGGGSLSQLGDVLLTSPLEGQLAFYDATAGKWKNKGIVGGPSGAIAVDTNLSPVEIELDGVVAKQYLSTVTPAADSIPRADATGKIAAGWLPVSTAAAHGMTHQNGGNDEIATATPAANAIPKANASGKLGTGWLPFSKLTQIIQVPPTSQTSGGTVNPGGGWSLPSANAAVVTTNNIGTGGDQMRTGALLFAFGVNRYALVGMIIPPSWDGTTPTAKLSWYTGSVASGTTVRWNIETLCMGPGLTITTLPYNAANSTTTTIAGGVRSHETSIPLTMTGCSAGQQLFMRVSREVGDTANGNASITGFSVSFVTDLQ